MTGNTQNRYGAPKNAAKASEKQSVKEQKSMNDTNQLAQ
jgi:hypothetical protein